MYISPQYKSGAYNTVWPSRVILTGTNLYHSARTVTRFGPGQDDERGQLSWAPPAPHLSWWALWPSFGASPAWQHPTKTTKLHGPQRVSSLPLSDNILVLRDKKPLGNQVLHIYGRETRSSEGCFHQRQRAGQGRAKHRARASSAWARALSTSLGPWSLMDVPGDRPDTTSNECGYSDTG